MKTYVIIRNLLTKDYRTEIYETEEIEIEPWLFNHATNEIYIELTEKAYQNRIDILEKLYKESKL